MDTDTHGDADPPGGPGAMFVFDGDCGFCSRYARWVGARVTAEVVPWQRLDDLSAVGLTAGDVACAAWWLDGSRRWAGGDAIARSLVAVGGPWTVLGRVMLRRPVRWLSRVAYGWIADHRHRLPGGTPACDADRARRA